MGEEGIEKNREHDYCNDQEGTVPPFEYVRGIIEDEQSLNLRSGKKGNDGSSSLPA
jgi:hypothetical protein